MVSPMHRRATATAFLLFVQQQFAGINAVVYFSTQIFRDAGVTSAVLSSLLVMLVNVAGTALCRRPHALNETIAPHDEPALEASDAFTACQGRPSSAKRQVLHALKVGPCVVQMPATCNVQTDDYTILCGLPD